MNAPFSVANLGDFDFVAPDTYCRNAIGITGHWLSVANGHMNEDRSITSLLSSGHYKERSIFYLRNLRIIQCYSFFYNDRVSMLSIRE